MVGIQGILQGSWGGLGRVEGLGFKVYPAFLHASLQQNGLRSRIKLSP